MAAVNVWYDQEGDYLEVIFEDAAASLEEIEEDVFERHTPDGRVIGFSIFNFTRHDRDQLRLPLAITAIPAK